VKKTIVFLMAFLFVGNVSAKLFVSASGGYGFSTKSSVIKDITLGFKSLTDSNGDVELDEDDLSDSSITGNSIRHTIKSNSIPVALLIGFDLGNKPIRFGIETSVRFHKTQAKAEGKGILNFNPPSLPQGGFTSSPDVIGATINKKADKMRLLMILPKIFYDYKINARATGYIGVGVGVGFMHIHSKVEVTSENVSVAPQISPNDIFNLNGKPTVSEVKVDNTIVAGQLVLGVSFKINKKASIFAEYQLTQTSKVKTPVNKSYTDNVGMVGIIFSIV
jgi:opacity protein-like surface antigen